MFLLEIRWIKDNSLKLCPLNSGYESRFLHRNCNLSWVSYHDLSKSTNESYFHHSLCPSFGHKDKLGIHINSKCKFWFISMDLIPVIGIRLVFQFIHEIFKSRDLMLLVEILLSKFVELISCLIHAFSFDFKSLKGYDFWHETRINIDHIISILIGLK